VDFVNYLLKKDRFAVENGKSATPFSQNNG
jgi:hypothetical protein